MEHNILREKVNKQTTISKSDSDNLSKYLEETDKLKVKINNLEDKLYELGVDPSLQFGYKSESDSNSDYSSYSSDKSETRPTKRVKHLNPDNNVDMTLLFPVFNVVIPFTFIIRFLSVMTSCTFLSLLYLNILPNLIVPLIGISLVDLLSLYFIVNLIKLMYKMYSTILIIHKSYLNGNYMVIYANFFFSMIMILWYFYG